MCFFSLSLCFQECPTNTPDFREEQCKERTLNIDLDVDWVPSKQGEINHIV